MVGHTVKTALMINIEASIDIARSKKKRLATTLLVRVKHMKK